MNLMDARFLPIGVCAVFLKRLDYPIIIYGTEDFEVNNDLRQSAISVAKYASLIDSAASIGYRAHLPSQHFRAATMKPSVSEADADVACANVLFHGHLLSEGFEESLRLFTSG